MNQKFKKELKHMEESHNEEIHLKESKISELSLLIKTTSRDLSKVSKQGDDYKGFNQDLNTRLCEAESEVGQMTAKCQELEEKLKHYSVDIAMDHIHKINDLEGAIEKEKMVCHEYRLEIAQLEERIQNFKHENLLLTANVEEMNFNEIELNEKIKKVQQSYENQVEDLTASKQETKSRWRDKFKSVSKELDIATEKIKILDNQVEDLNQNLEIQESKYTQEASEMEASLGELREENDVLKDKVSTFELDLKTKNKMLHHQKSLINKLAIEKDDMALEFEKSSKMYEVVLNEK
mmetsp:Transcript_32866/g.29165  ORF Transcript_32866/g.29165 Transcript_32866/m.29165 type:complete len:293 (+) Transcript_32866:398-1276(+)|eukprot:CAMPEP_0205811470 /NCGR_PEP_ID=MMETSP0205-20121125/15669_1 /ASSEMBLY_ACC=CAM_ASM_000278 /TAXON_ID=36767 /ORGANISM="Euplotes focardii, Strain TN1" /LENGTH=292 /DNA_ID=CAMNT_0053090671 /DNA_START=357 /DNA_END=1235 /DNA_ORIENTATION=+